VLYFYDYKEKFQSFHVKRVLTSTLMGFRYRFNKIILPYNSKIIKNIYTPFKKFTKGPVNKIIEDRLGQNLNQKTVNQNHYLILGGPVNYLNKFYETCINEIIELSNKTPIVFYKAHSSFNTHNGQYKDAFYRVISKYNIKYEELDINTP